MSKKGWYISGAMALLLATGGYYASAQTSAGLLHMAHGSGSTATTHQTIHEGVLTFHITSTTTQPKGARHYALNDWKSGGNAGSTPAEPSPPRGAASVATVTPRSSEAHPAPQTAPQTPPRPPSLAMIRDTLAHYTLVTPGQGRLPGWGPQQVWHLADGRGGVLTPVLGVFRGTANGEQEAIFVWHDQHFLGVTTNQITFDPSIRQAAGGFVVTYRQWPASMMYAAMGPGDADKQQSIGYTWNGVQLVPSYRGPVLAIQGPNPPTTPRLHLIWNGPPGGVPWGSLVYQVLHGPIRVTVTLPPGIAAQVYLSRNAQTWTQNYAAGTTFTVSTQDNPSIRLSRGVTRAAYDLMVQATSLNGAEGLTVPLPQESAEVIHQVTFQAHRL